MHKNALILRKGKQIYLQQFLHLEDNDELICKCDLTEEEQEYIDAFYLNIDGELCIDEVIKLQCIQKCELQKRLDNIRDKRKQVYPSIEDQLDTIYHEGLEAWKSQIKAVKDKYPIR